MVLFGIILDSASKIRREALKRLEKLEGETAERGAELRCSGLPWRD